MRLTPSCNDGVSGWVSGLTFGDIDGIGEAQRGITLNIINSVSNRLTFNKTMNPEQGVHDVYTKNTKVNEIERVSWT